MRDRLIELLYQHKLGFIKVEDLADHLLANDVIVPPCKVGQTVYKPIITSKGKPVIREIIVTSIAIDIDENGVSPDSYIVGHLKNPHCGCSAYFCEFGKTVFLSKEQAEKALGRSKE